ncbi:MAG: hypothetical protein IPN78_05920 [Candidatus Accumulibacter sp.]|nr:hypothetical protein [Candidatus Accumulibacter propinquus]
MARDMCLKHMTSCDANQVSFQNDEGEFADRTRSYLLCTWRGQSGVGQLVPPLRFDVWMTKHHPDNPWCRYADDGLVHCRTEQEAQAPMAALDARFAQCALQMHPDRGKIRYPKTVVSEWHPVTRFDFLGYLGARVVKNSSATARL